MQTVDPMLQQHWAIRELWHEPLDESSWHPQWHLQRLQEACCPHPVSGLDEIKGI